MMQFVIYKIKILSKTKPHSDTVDFKELAFYYKPIEKPVKSLKNIDWLAELSVIQTDQAFKGYAISYNIKIVERKDPIVQLDAIKLSIKDLFNDLLNETKGFKYQITLEFLLKKYKLNGRTEFRPFFLIQ